MRPDVVELLRACSLPVEDLSADLSGFLVARRGQQLIGTIGLQPCGDAGLLRSLAVAPPWRGRGLAHQLWQCARRLAQQLGVRQLFLLTTTAEPLFARWGFRRVSRGDAPEAVRATAEYQALCPESATLMSFALPEASAAVQQAIFCVFPADTPSSQVEVTTMTPQSNDEIRNEVRTHYGQVARTGGSCCAPGCCSPGAATTSTTTADGATEAAMRIGYSPEELARAPEGANLGLGCGNPQAIAALRPGETVLDLGSGGGFDCFLAARQVGPEGRVVGVDMTADMIGRARTNAAKAGLTNVEFRLGEIEHLPVADQSVDVILSNCVINLSPDKAAVFREAFRVLRPGGRLAISDIVALGPLPEEIRRDLSLYTGCVAGAATVPEVEGQLREAGFVDVRVTVNQSVTEAIAATTPGQDLAALAASASIEASRPAGGGRV
jgi:SAM-dependent methyltransferase/N-acetylglutamate synthase-like GNAT family acetyltransferase